MKRIITLISVCSMLATACDYNTVPQLGNAIYGSSELIPVSLHLMGVTTKALESSSMEKQIKDLQVFVYTVDSEGNKAYDSYYSFGAGDGNRTIYIDKNSDAVSYWVAAYANHPKITAREILEDWSLLSNESTDNFQMVGAGGETVENLIKVNTLQIELVRQCSKVSVKEIEIAWTNTGNKHKTFKLKGMYLMDVPGVLKNHFDLSSDIANNQALWQNKNGYYPSNLDNLLYDSIDDVTVSEDTPYTTGHIFYGYINPSLTYNSTSSWAPGGTRLVIEAEFDEAPCYYAVALNKVDGVTVFDDLRNKHIEFSKITITRPGASAPYEALPDESPVTVSVSVQPWQPGFSGDYTIQ